jgi:hypothetical protein
VYPGDPGIPKTFAPTHWDNFGPRVGIAYSPGFTDGFLGRLFGGPGKTSIRAASGIYYTAIEDLTLFFDSNHPSAVRCLGCGAHLSPGVESEVRKVGLHSA